MFLKKQVSSCFTARFSGSMNIWQPNLPHIQEYLFFAILSTEASIVLCLTIPTCIFSVLHMGQGVLYDPMLLFWVVIMWQLPAMGHLRRSFFLGHCYKPCRFFDWPWQKSVRETILPCLGLVLPGWVFLEPNNGKKAQFILVDIKWCLGRQLKMKTVRII